MKKKIIITVLLVMLAAFVGHFDRIKIWATSFNTRTEKVVKNEPTKDTKTEISVEQSYQREVPKFTLRNSTEEEDRKALEATLETSKDEVKRLQTEIAGLQKDIEKKLSLMNKSLNNH